MTPDGTAWRDFALCRQIDSAAPFYPERGESSVAAKRICAMCSVKALCLAEALATPEVHDHGVWGGTSAYERRRLRRERAGRLAPVVTLPVPSVPDRRAA